VFRSTLVTVVIAAGLALAPALRADDKDDKEGWVQLFNGKDLTGWKIHPMPNKEITEITEKKVDGKVVAFEGTVKGKKVPLWRVEDGTIVGGGPSTHLFSERDDYADFVYRVEARINDHGNSGQYFRTAFGPGFPTGYEAQINATHGDPVKTGSLYPDPRTTLKDSKDKITVMNTAAHKPDEWFTQEVTAVGPKITIKVNGKTTVDWEDPEYRYKKGHFALQAHDPGSIMTFRKVEVKELKK
jgi:3-keto-disaccharide hydrolase